MQVNIQSKDIEMTDAIRSYAQEKMAVLEKYCDRCERIDCELEMDSNHHNQGDIYVCKGHLFVPGKDFFVEKREEDLYKAIDKVQGHLKEALIEWKEKRRDKEEQIGEVEISES
jgi:putative sigma-54 modulation protein